MGIKFLFSLKKINIISKNKKSVTHFQVTLLFKSFDE